MENGPDMEEAGLLTHCSNTNFSFSIEHSLMTLYF